MPRGGAWGPSQPRGGPLGLDQSFNPMGLVQPLEPVQPRAGPLGPVQPRAGLLRLVQPRGRPLGPVQPLTRPFRPVEHRVAPLRLQPSGPFGLVQNDGRQPRAVPGA